MTQNEESALLIDERLPFDKAEREGAAVQSLAETTAEASTGMRKTERSHYAMAAFILENSQKILGIEPLTLIDIQNKLAELRHLKNGETGQPEDTFTLAKEFTGAIEIAVSRHTDSMIGALKKYWEKKLEGDQAPFDDRFFTHTIMREMETSPLFDAAHSKYPSLRELGEQYVSLVVKMVVETASNRMNEEQQLASIESPQPKEENAEKVIDAPLLEKNVKSPEIDPEIDEAFAKYLRTVAGNTVSVEFFPYDLIAYRNDFFGSREMHTEQFPSNASIPEVGVRVSSVKYTWGYAVWIEKTYRPNEYLIRYQLESPPVQPKEEDRSWNGGGNPYNEE